MEHFYTARHSTTLNCAENCSNMVYRFQSFNHQCKVLEMSLVSHTFLPADNKCKVKSGKRNENSNHQSWLMKRGDKSAAHYFSGLRWVISHLVNQQALYLKVLWFCTVIILILKNFVSYTFTSSAAAHMQHDAFNVSIPDYAKHCQITWRCPFKPRCMHCTVFSQSHSSHLLRIWRPHFSKDMVI